MNNDELKKSILDLCETYQPRKPGLAKAINDLILLASANASLAGRLPPTHGDTILAVTPDGQEFVCAMEVDELLSEAEGRVVSDMSMRMGIDIQYGPASDGITCDEGDGCLRTVPAYSSEELDRLRQVEADASANAAELTQLREAVKLLGTSVRTWKVLDEDAEETAWSVAWRINHEAIDNAYKAVESNPIAAEAVRGEP